MIHLNGNLLCAVDVETTGRTPYHHDIIQFSVLPLDTNMEPHKDYIPFDVRVRPKRPENYDDEALTITRNTLVKVINEGIDADRVVDLFEDWFHRLKLPEGKNIVPLAQNWPFDREFVIDLLGREHFSYFFHGHYRDTMAVALFLNDRADFNAEQVKYAKVGLMNLANRLNVHYDKSGLHDSLYDCFITSKVYKKFLTEYFL